MCFIDLCGTRGVGMGVEPITFREIEAYRRLTHADLWAWETLLIRRLDDTVRGITAPVAVPGSISAEPAAIPATDTNAVRSMFRDLQAQRAARPAPSPTTHDEGDAHG